jgi:hypothetical protein
MGEYDDDSFVKPSYMVRGKALHDASKKDLETLNPQDRIRKHAPTFISYNEPGQFAPERKPKKVLYMGEDWDKSKFKPKMIDEVGQTFPKFAVKQQTSTLSYDEFAKEELESPDEDSVDSIHIDADKCEAFINTQMQRAGTEKELKKRLKTFTTNESKEAYEHYHIKSGKIVKNEVELALHTNKIRLKFVPQPTSRQDDSQSGKIRGEYFAIVEKEDGSKKEYQVANNWVEDNFTAECLSVVQQIAQETREVYKNRSTDKTEIGYVGLAKENNLKN